jgi:hypothetical protein
MIWAILALLGVPLWLCTAGILVVALNNRRLRKRHGDIPVRVSLNPPSSRWTTARLREEGAPDVHDRGYHANVRSSSKEHPLGDEVSHAGPGRCARR